MPIVSSDIKYKLSGGASNSDPNASIGGAVSANDAPAGVFSDVTSAEAAAGKISYRCEYVKNTHATLTLIGAKVWVQTNTPSADTDISIGLGAAAVNATETAIANETTAPSGVSFSAPASEGAGLVIGDLAPGATKAIWIKRVVNAGAAVYADSYTLRVKGDTNP